MKMLSKLLFFSVIIFLCIGKNAFANISPLTIKEDGVEPVKASDVKIEYEDITVSPNGSRFLLSCKYGLKGNSDIESLCVGIPGDLGYTLEAGYIEDMNILVNGQPVKAVNYNTTEHLTASAESSKISMHFNWYVFSVPIKKDTVTSITATYNISWRILQQNQKNTYYIIPFLMSTDSYFGYDSGKYKITYINDDHISIPDAKVTVSSMFEPDIISSSIQAPEYNGDRVTWNFKKSSDFQDFRFVVLSFRKLALDLTAGTPEESSVRWALLNNNYTRLANIFEDIARREKAAGSANNNETGTASYLASEYYFRAGNYNRALEMLNSQDKITIWPSQIKYDYINAVKHEQSFQYGPLIDELKKLSGYKDYVLVSNYANQKIGPISSAYARQEFESPPVIPKDTGVKKKQSYDIYIYIGAGVLFLTAIIFIIIRIVKLKKKKTFW